MSPLYEHGTYFWKAEGDQPSVKNQSEGQFLKA